MLEPLRLCTCTTLVLPVIHFNDVYALTSDADGHEPVGGAARFATAVQRVRDMVSAGALDTGGLPALEPLILFSGDALSPSTSEQMSSK